MYTLCVIQGFLKIYTNYLTKEGQTICAVMEISRRAKLLTGKTGLLSTCFFFPKEAYEKKKTNNCIPDISQVPIP